jgi:hypothetical protein
MPSDPHLARHTRLLRLELDELHYAFIGDELDKTSVKCVGVLRGLASWVIGRILVG